MIKLKKVRKEHRGEFVKSGDKVVEMGEHFDAQSEDEAEYLCRFAGFERVKAAQTSKSRADKED